MSEALPASIGSTNYQRVCDRLRSDILNGDLAPGTRLKVVELASRYGLSQMPVREAIQQLQGEGLVLVVPNRGASVRAIDRRLVVELFDIRIALEGTLAREAALRLGEPDVAAIEAARIRFETERHDPEARVANNHRLHLVINELSGNAEAVRIISQHLQLLHGLRRRFGWAPARLEVIIEEHRGIVRALAERDAVTAERISEQHIRAAKDDMLAQMGE